MSSRNIQFQGSYERLCKLISHKGGEHPHNQKFSITWESAKFKPLARLSFCFHCSYEKNDVGYDISYQIVPTIPSIIRLLLSVLILTGLLALNTTQATGSIAIFSFLIFIGAAINCYLQMTQCRQEFNRAFSVASTPQKQAKTKASNTSL